MAEGAEQLAIFLAQKAEEITSAKFKAEQALGEVDGVQVGIKEIITMLHKFREDFVSAKQYAEDKETTREAREAFRALIEVQFNNLKDKIKENAEKVEAHEKLNAPMRDQQNKWGGSFGLGKWAVPIIVTIVLSLVLVALK